MGRPTVLAFFKTTCPTCELSFPVWGELARRYADAVPIVAVSQDPEAKARTWLDRRGFDGPVHDDTDGYPLSDEHGVTTVPTLVLVDEDGTPVHRSEGWSRDVANDWDARLAALAGVASPGPASTPDDGLPVFKPG